MTTANIGRLITAMVTPFKPSGEMDLEQAQRLALALLASGSDGLVVAGTTGEAPTLSTDEELDLYRAVKEAVGDKGSVLAATSSYNTAESVEVSRAAARTGVDGLLLVVPYYNKPPQEGLQRHMEAIAAAVDLPCVIYNIPGRTGVNMAPETIIKTAQAAPNVIGVKEASGNLDAVSKMVAELGSGFRIWSGDDQLILPMLSVGGYGAVSVTSHLAGRQIKAMIEDYLAGRVAETAATHRNLLPLMTALMTIAANPVPVKHALNALGFNAGPLRLPLSGLDEAASALLMAEVSRHQIDIETGVTA
ncbi:MAG: 4-hydroxy-tetrahydrodipicolinate synthase [Dehalococcoidia bacterium]|nr:4-hydroxy-tetrahydrodipicolinate synthase [Dehalococcoidia bacterium]